MTQYQYHKRQYNSLEEKLSFLKTRAQMSQHSHLPLQQQKQKKKPRPVDQGSKIYLDETFFVYLLPPKTTKSITFSCNYTITC